MNEILAISIGAIFVNNFVLTRFLGLSSFIKLTKKLDVVLFIGIITTFIMTISSFLSFIVNSLILKPLNINFLKILLFIIIIFGLVELTKFIIKNIFSYFYKSYENLFPIIMTNCAILGISILTINHVKSITGSLVYGFTSGLGYLLVLYLMTTILEKLELSEIPESFKGVPIAFITAGIMALAFLAADQSMLEYLK